MGASVESGAAGQVRHDLPVEEEDDAAVVRHAADHDRVELPLVEDREDLVEPVAARRR